MAVPELATPAGIYLPSEDGLSWVLTGHGAIPTDHIPPSAPSTGPVVDAFTSSTISISWGAASDNIAVDHYEARINGGPWAVVPGAGLSFTFGSLAASTAYTINVTALDLAQNRGPAGTVTQTTSSGGGGGGGGPHALIGMSSEGAQSIWDSRRATIEAGAGGGKIRAYRIFFSDDTFSSQRSLVQSQVAQGVYPVMSFKLPTGVTWAQAAAGQIDPLLASTHTWLASLNAEVFVCLHHEPGTGNNPTLGENGTPVDHANMDIHCLPILKGGLSRIKVGIIGNGYWFNASNKAGFASDAQLNAWMPPAWRAIADVAAFDTYQSGADYSSRGPDITLYNKAMVAWAARTGGINGLGVGEFNAFDPQLFTNLLAYVATQPLYRWICLWNTIHPNSRAGYLGQPGFDPDPTGPPPPNGRLLAFQAALAAFPFP